MYVKLTDTSVIRPLSLKKTGYIYPSIACEGLNVVFLNVFININITFTSICVSIKTLTIICLKYTWTKPGQVSGLINNKNNLTVAVKQLWCKLCSSSKIL